MTGLMKPAPVDHELERLLKEAKARWAAMTPEQQEVELKKQAESWARQDMD